MTVRRMSRDAWMARARELYGDNPRKWKFRCVACGNVQSAESVDANNPALIGTDKSNWIFFACEGRHTEGRGCDWSLGGLFQIHRLEVVWAPGPSEHEDARAEHHAAQQRAEETVHQVFEFADDPVGDWKPSTVPAQDKPKPKPKRKRGRRGKRTDGKASGGHADSRGD